MPINKKKNVNNLAENGEENMDAESSSSEYDSDEVHPDAYTGNEEIQVDFEGRNPIDSDFHGIRQLLSQIFLKAHINLSEMADLIVGQNYIGSVVMQSEIDEEDDDDDDMGDDSNVIFGITTAINITQKKEIGCIQQLKSYILEKLESNPTSDEIKTQIKNILNDDDKDDGQSVGFLINERFINIPAQISIPLLENLCKEIKRANDKKMPYNFTYYVMLIKFYRKNAKKGKPAEDIYSNPEEEIFCKEAKISFEYSVQSEADTGMTGQWLENDSSLTPYRKVIVFDANKLPQIVSSITEFIKE